MCVKAPCSADLRGSTVTFFTTISNTDQIIRLSLTSPYVSVLSVCARARQTQMRASVCPEQDLPICNAPSGLWKKNPKTLTLQ